MDAPVSAFLGATGPLIRKLEVLLLNTSEDDPKRWPRLPKGVRDGIDHLKDDLEEISTYLEDLSELEDPPLTAKCWMKEVRELSYDMEDYIDSLARHSCRTNIKTRSVCKISHVEVNRLPRRKKVAWHKQVRINISEFRIRVQDANQRHRRYGLDCLTFRRRYASSGPMLPKQHDEAADLVIDGQMSEFMDTLACDGDHQLKVVSIVGSGGLGKTTFARTLYNKIRGQFDCRAYVSMTRKPNIKKVLRDILTQVRREEARDDCEDVDITGRITKHLLGKRYLIVTDDLWAASAWNVISRAFPEGTQRSRIVVTTQVVDVALTCCCYQPELVFEMKPLDVYHSRKLFFNKIFGSESDCPEMFKEISCKIVDRCGGSPLATSNMASLLASHSVLLMEQWAYISDSLSTMLRRSSTSEGLRLVLNLSYNNLSHHLKSCLLYLTKYPEGCIICTDDLVKQWVAEGFIEATEGRDVESVARSYFDELIDRRFIQPARIKYNGEIVSCTVHDTVYDLIAYNSAAENFVMVVDTDRKNVELSDKVRRLSLNFGDAISAKKPRNISSSHVRSLAFSGFFALPSIAEFKLLRVLNLQLSGHRGEDILDLTGISELFQLRYLKVVSDVCIELPKHMRGLQHLETLDMDAEVTAVPWDIIHLPCLWHLHLPLETNLMDWISDMRSDIVRRLDKLTNMRDFRVTCSTAAPNHLKKNMEALGSLLRGLGNLEMLALVPGSSHGNAVVRGPSEVVVVSWDGFTPPLHLKRFEWSLCSCIFSRVPKWAGEFGNLCVLKIMVKELFRDGVDILKGLPALTALSLYVHAATVERIVFDKAGFLALKFFKFRCSGVPWLKFEAGAMPNLLKLKLGFNANRVDQHRNTHIIIEHLPSLKQIYAKIGGASAAAESALRATVINHPSNPSINIQWVDWMFFGHEGRSRATEDKEQADIVEETAEEVSWEHAKKQANIRISTPSVNPSYLQVSDIQQILKEAQHRWLRPAEICEILKSYRNFRIAPEPPKRPPSGSLFLFDREKLRYFWKDGHNWRKKNDQQTVKEAYEKLKSGSVDVIYCNYAHDEENISFQRRTYSVLEENFRHIVLVHYRDTKFSTATADISAMENSFPQNDDGSVEAAIDYTFLKTQSSSQSDILKDSIKESDSFTRWMCKELSDVDDSQIQSSFGIFEASSCEPLDQFSVAPMVSQSQDQLFSSVDFAPSWTYVGSKTKAPPIKPFDNQLSLDDLDAIKLIGKGRSGIVQLVRHKWTGQLFALKVIQVNFHEAIQRQIVQELKISLSTECPYVVTCCQCFDVYGAISIVLEYMDGGSLSDFLKTVKTIPEFYLAAICKQVLRGLVYLHHERCIMHRNLKPSNILINHRGEVKISDFGVCAIISGSSGEQGTFTSTVNYMAPEIISGQKHGYMNDIWSLGLVMLECATGNFPYPARESFYELLEALVDQPPPSASPEQFSKEFCSFISACIQMDARDRSSAQILLGHPFLSMFDDLNVDLASYFTTIGSPLATTDIYKVPDGKQETGADAVGP